MSLGGDNMSEESKEQHIEDDFNLFVYINAILRAWWFIGPMSLIGAGVALYYSMQLPLKYQASCRFEIFMNQAVKIGQDIREAKVQYNYLDRYKVLFLSSRLNGPIRAKLAKKYPNLGGGKYNPFEVYVVQVRGTKSMLDIKVNSFNKDAAKEYLVALVDGFEKMRLEEAGLESKVTVQALKDEEDRLNIQVQNLQEKIDNFKIENNFIFLETKTDFDKKYISELLEKARDVQFQLDILNTHMSDLEDEKKDSSMIFTQVVDSFSSLNRQGEASGARSLITDINQWKAKQITLRTIQAEYQRKLLKYKPAHPKMREIEDRREIVRIEQEEYSKNILSTIKGRIKTMEAEKKSYFDKARDIEDSIGGNSEVLTTYQTLREKYESLNSMKNHVRMKALLLTSNADRFFTRMVQKPNAGSSPVWPSNSKNATKGFMVMFGFSCAVVLLRFVAKSRRYNYNKVMKEFDIGCLATIPTFPATKIKRDPYFLNTVPKSSVLSEAYRSLRLEIQQKLGNSNSLVVTSFGPGEGKTVTSLNLALCWAWTGKKILLVDADFRRATLRRHFREAPKEGVIDFLQSDSNEIEKYIISNISENLSYLPAGHSTELITELIETDKMSMLIKHLEGEYDMVIFDTAPATRVVDTIKISELTAATIIVSRSSKTLPDQVSLVCKRLDKEKLAGFVMNDFRSSHVKFASHGAKGVESYSHGYAYQSYKKKY